MKKLVCLALALVMLLALCACGAKTETPAAETKTDAAAETKTETKTEETKKEDVDTIEFSCALAVPEGEYFVTVMEEMSDRLYERTEGRYAIKVYAGATLCSQAELFGMLKSGGVTMGEAPIECQSAADARFAAVQLPFAFDNLQANVNFNKLANERLYNAIIAEKFNAFPLFSVSSGMMQYFSTGDRVETLDQLKGQLLWVNCSLSSATATALGASPVMLEWQDGYPAMQKHTVDGSLAASCLAPYNFHWEDALKSITYCNICASSSNMYMSLDLFNAMSEEDQQILLEEAAITEADLQNYYYDMDQKLEAGLNERGIDTYHLPEAEMQAWRDAVTGVYDEYYAQMSAEDAEIIRQCIEEANAG